MSHHCHARGCRRACPPRHLMCARHWRMVPERLRTRVWATYRASSAWLEATDAAIDAVAELEAEARRHDELARRQIGFDFGRLR